MELIRVSKKRKMKFIRQMITASKPKITKFIDTVCWMVCNIERYGKG